MASILRGTGSLKTGHGIAPWEPQTSFPRPTDLDHTREGTHDRSEGTMSVREGTLWTRTGRLHTREGTLFGARGRHPEVRGRGVSMESPDPPTSRSRSSRTSAPRSARHASADARGAVRGRRCRRRRLGRTVPRTPWDTPRTSWDRSIAPHPLGIADTDLRPAACDGPPPPYACDSSLPASAPLGCRDRISS
jgi:hypothetical protein